MKSTGFMGNDPVPIAVLDTNVIFPLYCRDVLLWFAHFNLFVPKWSTQIFDEWIRVMTNRGLTPERISRQIALFEGAFPEAHVHEYEHLIADLTLSDPKDRHVVAAAIISNAKYIVTHNLRDFASPELEPLGLKALPPDDFLSELTCRNQRVALQAFAEMVAAKKKPALSAAEVLNRISRNGLPKTASLLKSCVNS